MKLTEFCRSHPFKAAGVAVGAVGLGLGATGCGGVLPPKCDGLSYWDSVPVDQSGMVSGGRALHDPPTLSLPNNIGWTDMATIEGDIPDMVKIVWGSSIPGLAQSCDVRRDDVTKLQNEVSSNMEPTVAQYTEAATLAHNCVDPIVVKLGDIERSTPPNEKLHVGVAQVKTALQQALDGIDHGDRNEVGNAFYGDANHPSIEGGLANLNQVSTNCPGEVVDK